MTWIGLRILRCLKLNQVLYQKFAEYYYFPFIQRLYIKILFELFELKVCLNNLILKF